MQQIDHQRRAGHREKKNRLPTAVDHSMAGIERDRKKASLLPFEVHLAAVIAGRPDFRRATAGDNVDQLFVQMIFGMERSARRNFADIHAGEAFHPFEIDVSTPASGSLPWLERQLGDIFNTEPADDGNSLFPQPQLVTGFALRHDQCPFTCLD